MSHLRELMNAVDREHREKHALSDDQFLVNMLNAGGTWPDRPIAHTEQGRRLMRKGLIELVKPDPDDYPGMAVPLPYAALTIAGVRRARERLRGRRRSRHPLRGENICGLHIHTNLEIVSGTYNYQVSNLWYPGCPYEQYDMFGIPEFLRRGRRSPD